MLKNVPPGDPQLVWGTGIRFWRLAGLSLGLMLALLPQRSAAADRLPAAADKAVEFTRDVQPILRDHCLKCHGPQRQESNFRVDQRQSLLAGGDFGEPGLVPGQSSASHLIALVAGVGGDWMPPKDKGKPLSSEQVGLLRAWIDQGAKMPKDGGVHPTPSTTHWSFQPIVRHDPPELKSPGQSQLQDEFLVNAIDAFVLAKLQEQGLRPSPPVDRATLIRRLYVDMLGLLPSPEEVRSFVSDSSPRAYEDLVERVLASKHYGERWARHWLDVVRFAESNGFETNVERPHAFRYRDWVIRALNSDMPYQEFVFHQLAGDSSGEDAATGFLVGGAYDLVKSPDATLTAMQRQDELADMINTTGTAFLGLTLGCARCHSHKFDPILQKDYYSFQAIFAGVRHGVRTIKPSHNSTKAAAVAAATAEVHALQRQLTNLGVLPPVNPRQNEERFEPKTARFVRFTITATNSAEPCIDELEIWTAGEKSQNVGLASAGARATSSGNYQGNPKHKLEHINDKRLSNDFSWISDKPGGGWVQIELASSQRIDRIVWGRDRTGKYQDRLATKYRIEVATEEDQWEQVASSAARLPISGTGDLAVLRDRGLSEPEAAKAAELLKRFGELQAHIRQLQEPAQAYAGTFVQPPATYRLYRGDPASPRERVSPETLTVLHQDVGALGLGFDTPEQQRRIELAKWITSAKNPLTARVLVNRLWHYHFGRGILSTPSDFGAMGARPTHPRLLDWLAAELIANDGSLKHIHRLIVLSGTFRQSHKPRKVALAQDKDATLLWRFPPRRMEAEAIRDNILLISGALDRRMYGRGFLLFHPNNNYSRNWVAKDEFGPAEFRRMIYATDLRMELDAVFGAFDCPDGGQIAPQRSRSTTPIQALNLLNSPFIVQQAQLAADRVRRDVGDDVAAQVARLFELALGRTPTADQSAAAQTLVRRHGLASLCRAMFNSNEFLFIP